jgi:outer membrane protein
MPPVDIETDITNPQERWFTQASGLEHMESRSMLGVSIIKAIFQSGTSADADVTQLSNLAMADLKRLPPGTRHHRRIDLVGAAHAYAGQQVTIARSAYYPQVTGDLTGSEGNENSRIGAGDLSASRLFDRFGQGVVAQQLITDSGRTPSLVASSRLQSQASQQDLQASRYDVLLQVNRAYFNLQRAQAVVKVAQATVAERQLLDDQVTELVKNNLRSQLDASFAEVQVSQAKLLLLQAQEDVQQALAELGAALGSDQPANLQLTEEPMPASPPKSVDDLIAQAVANRPELASLRLARDAANKFAEAEKDLSRPTVSAVAVAGFLPFVKQEGSTTIPDEYEGIGANLSIPVFNGHLFAARRSAAQERALESDQKLAIGRIASSATFASPGAALSPRTSAST